MRSLGSFCYRIPSVPLGLASDNKIFPAGSFLL
jgi:hypothetical protein